MKIAHTSFDAQHPWPDDIRLLQGGSSGLVIRPESQGGNYGTAFVEAFPEGTFIRGEGPTVPEAETACWEKFQRQTACPGHEYEPRKHRNGCGFCKHCNHFASGVFTPEDLGCFCSVCGVPTFYTRIADKLLCEVHGETPEARELLQQRLREVNGTEETATGSALGDFFARMEARRASIPESPDS